MTLDGEKRLTELFTLTPLQTKSIAAGFCTALERGLAGLPSSLKMLPAYLTLPDGSEQGTFLTVDFGGTNLRVLMVELALNGNMTILQRRDVPFYDEVYGRNLLFAEASAEELFDFIAEQLAALDLPSTVYSLGHTFSFPCIQTDINNAVLLRWTKEIQTLGVEGQEVNVLLRAALNRRGLSKIIPRAVINDTVGTLLTAAYGNPRTRIGTICGTGHNTCYLEPRFTPDGKPMIINMEAGNFDQFPCTAYDKLVDIGSVQPGQQRLEKAVSGRYIGEVFRVVMTQLLQEGVIFPAYSREIFAQPYAITAEELSVMLSDGADDLNYVRVWLEAHGVYNAKHGHMKLLRTLADIIVRRSARLVASTCWGVLAHLDPGCEEHHEIAVDGSLYEKMPGYKDEMAKTIEELAGGKVQQISVRLVKDGSGFGAALAAAMAK